MRMANAVLVTLSATLTTMFLGQSAAAWERPLPPDPARGLTPGQAAFIERQIALNKALFLGAAAAWLATIGVAAARRLGRPTIRSALAALATLAAMLTAVSIAYVVAVEAELRMPYPHPEQAAYHRYHVEVINIVIWAVLLAWLLTGVALFLYLGSLAVRRVRDQGGPVDATRSDRHAATEQSPREGAEGNPASDSLVPLSRPGRLVRGFAALQWWLTLAWLFLAERGILSGLSRLRDLGDAAFMRQYANPHLYAGSEAIQATAEIIAGAILLAMTVAGFALVPGLRRGRRWSRRLALAQSALLLLAGGVVSLSLAYAKSWKFGDACQTMLPGLFLGLFTLVLWSPRFGADFSRSDVTSGK